MKIASFKVGQKASYGIKVDQRIIDLGNRLGERYVDLRALLEGDGITAAGAFLHELPDYQDDEALFVAVWGAERDLC